MVAPRAVPEAVSRTPRVIVVEGLVVIRVCPRLSVDPLLGVHARSYLVVIVVMLDDFRRCQLSLNDAGRRLSFNFSPFIVFPFAVPRTIVICGEHRCCE